MMNVLNQAPTRLRALAVPHRLALLGIVLLSGIFNFWQLGQNGYGNLYYAAAVRSMGSNWHAFFFASLDPAGFVTVDKPPVGFWFQVLSTKILGYSPFAIFLPQALAGVLSVVLLYWLVRRHFGRVAGLLAALALAVSPISVVTNRNNTIDSTLMLFLLLAAWATFRAIETDQLRWLVASGLLVAVGFNIKMLEAYLVVPAFFLTYILGSQRGWARRVSNLAIAGATMVAVSLAWVFAVDIIPATLRPWVGSTTNNSELSLAFGYNGLQRLTGSTGGSGGSGGGFPGGGRRPEGGFPGDGFPGGGFPGGNFPGGSRNGELTGFAGNGTPGAGGPGGGGVGGGMFNTGNPGLLRLFTNPLGGQIVWLLPLALIGMVAFALQRPFRPREDRQQQSLILWGTWLVTMVVFFSAASFFHQYYLSQMAPAIAALVGIGLVSMWQQFGQAGWKGWLLPFALAVTALVQIAIIKGDSSWGTWLVPVLVITAVVATAALVVVRLRPTINFQRQLGIAAVTIGMVGLLAAPTVWSAYPAWANTAPDLPEAGLAGAGSTSVQVNSTLVSYLEAHQGSATYLVAVTSSNESAPIIITTGKSVMTLGGFTGSDPILTVAQVQTLVNNGTIRYFLLAGTTTATTTEGTATDTPSGNGGAGNALSSVTQWVQQNCTTVASSAWQSTSSGASTGGFGGNEQLYDCMGK